MKISWPLAPKPVILLTKEQDYFDIRGGERAFQHLKHLYQQLGAANNVALFTGPTGHGYSQENREAMYGWFNQWTEFNREDEEEPSIQLEPDEQLWCAPEGQVARLESRTVASFTAEKAQQLQSARERLRGEPLRVAVRRLLPLAIENDVPEYRILRPLRGRGYPLPEFTTYVIETDPGVQAIVYRLTDATRLSRPPQEGGTALLYVSDLSSDAELREDEWLRNLVSSQAKAGVDVYTCDVRGTGESQPDTCGENSFLQPYGSDFFYAIHAIMLGDPYPAQKTRDVLRVVAWLKAQGREQVHLVAQGRGTIPAALAALLSDDIQQVTLQRPLVSFQSIAESESYQWPFSCFVPGVLEVFDLPDVYATVASEKQLSLQDVRGPDAEPMLAD